MANLAQAFGTPEVEAAFMRSAGVDAPGISDGPNRTPGRVTHEVAHSAWGRATTLGVIGCLTGVGIVTDGIGPDRPSLGQQEAMLGYDNVDLPAGLQTLGELELISADSSASVDSTTTSAAERGITLSDVLQCKPDVNDIVFYADLTENNYSGTPIEGDTIDEVKAEAYYRFAHDPMTLAAKRHSANLDKLSTQGIIDQTKAYMNDQALWERDCQELIDAIENASVVEFKMRNGTYLTEYILDDVNGDGVPELVQGYMKTVNSEFKVLRIVFEDGTVAEWKLSCGLQDVQFEEEETPPTTTPPTTSPPTTTPPTTTPPTTSPPTTTPPTTTPPTTTPPTTTPPTTTPPTTTPPTTSPPTTTPLRQDDNIVSGPGSPGTTVPEVEGPPTPDDNSDNPVGGAHPTTTTTAPTTTPPTTAAPTTTIVAPGNGTPNNPNGPFVG